MVTIASIHCTVLHFTAAICVKMTAEMDMQKLAQVEDVVV